MKQINEIELYEEHFWKNKSRDLFIKCGDKNTKYFQEKVRGRHKINNITYLKENDVWLHGRSALGNHISSFFSNLFSS